MRAGIVRTLAQSVPRFLHCLGKFAQRGVQLMMAAFGQLDLALEQQTVGESVLAGNVRGFGLRNQVFTADDAVLVITEQRLDRLGLLSHLVRTGSRRRIA